MGGEGAQVDVQWVQAHLDDPRVRVVEGDVSRAAYDEGHIPGAVLWNAYEDLRDADYRPVALDELAGLLSRSGITPETTVVVYGYSAPLAFWLLKAHGHEDTRILPGKRERWAQAGHEWSAEVPEPARAEPPPLAARSDYLATREQVQAAIADPSQLLLDVRAENEYSGERFWPSGATENVGRAGHIPGALNVPISRLREPDGTLKGPDELRRALDDAGVPRDRSLITYCTIGNRASEAWYALTHVLDYPDVRVYYSSWVEWGNEPDTPITTEDAHT